MRQPDKKPLISEKARQRPVRVLPPDEDAEMRAGHIIPAAGPLHNEAARGGFGNREGKEGYGTESGDGATNVGSNDDTEESENSTDSFSSFDDSDADLK